VEVLRAFLKLGFAKILELQLFWDSFSGEVDVPVYAYECATCEKRFEVNARMSDPPPARGEDCTSDQCRLTKIMSPVAIGSASGKMLGKPSQEQTTNMPKPTHSCGFGCKH
jgi:putative FmdB family regulatory protein